MLVLVGSEGGRIFLKWQRRERRESFDIGPKMDEITVCTGRREDPGAYASPRSRIVEKLEQLDRGNFQGVALQVAGDVHTKVIFLVRSLERFGDFGIAFGIEF